MELGIGISFFVIFIAFGIAYFIFWITAVMNAARNECLESMEKLAWIAAMFFFPFFGVIFYWLLAERPEKIDKRHFRENEFV